MNSNEPTHHSSKQNNTLTSRSGINHRSDRQHHIPPDAPQSPNTTETNNQPNYGRPHNENSSDIDAKVLAYIQENHLQLNLPLLLPDANELQKLRQVAPEVYSEYIYAIHASTDTDAFERRAAYEIPAQYARRGQRYGLVAVISVLVLAGGAIAAGSPILAGILGVVDLVALAAVFQNVTHKEASKNSEETT